MTKVFLAAGVAALAIAVPATAGPGGHGGGRNQVQAAGGGGGGARMQAVQRGGGGGGFAAPRIQRGGGGGGFAAPRMQRAERMDAPRMAAPRMQRAERVAAPRMARAERMAARPAQSARIQTRAAERQQLRTGRVQAQNRMADRQQLRANRQQMQTRQAQVQNRAAARQQFQANRRAQVQNRMAGRQQIQANRQAAMQDRMNARQQIQANREGAAQARIAANQQTRFDRQAVRGGIAATTAALATTRFDPVVARAAVPMTLMTRTQVVPVAEAVQYVGQPVSAVTAFGLTPLPASFDYLYPPTPGYSYEYGGGYLYQVDQSSNLIAALIPLLAGGYMPGQYLPTSYMSSYVPDYYGLSSFYPASYAEYGGYGGYGGYDNLCNRYANGVIYQVDCYTGMVENVIPMYAGGYGVGQMLPSAYSAYNVPYQYRSMYYNTPDYGYYYAPGAIYQYDTRTSLISSVAALLSPGFSVGQQLPMGYDVYNVPYAYRSTYYDTPTAMYRYNNGYIYQVDPTSMMVTAIVASALS